MSEPTKQPIQPTSSSKFGKKKKPDTTNKEKAIALADLNAPQISINVEFTGFHSEEHGNVFVDLDCFLPERFLASGIQRVSTECRQVLKHTGRESTDTMSLLAATLNLSMALKLIQATPTSKRIQIDRFVHLEDLSIMTPLAFVQVLDLIGKTDENDMIIRIEQNADLIRRLLIKGTCHLFKHEEYLAELGLTPEDMREYKKLKTFAFSKPDKIIFKSMDSVRKLREMGREHLAINRDINAKVQVNGVEILVSPPALSKTATEKDVATYVGNVSLAFANRAQIQLSAMMSVFQLKWFDKLDTKFGEIDPATWSRTVMSGHTPQELLDLADFCYAYELYDEDDLYEMSGAAFSYVVNKVPLLSDIVRMIEQSKSTIGSSGQLVTIDRTKMKDSVQLAELLDSELSVGVPTSYNTILRCSRKLAASQHIIGAGSFAITKGVRYKDNFVGHTTKHMKSYAEKIVSRMFHRPL